MLRTHLSLGYTYLAKVIPADNLNEGRLDAYNLGPTIYPKIICADQV